MLKVAKLFCNVSSIRGAQKIVKSKHCFIKTIWIIFVTSMTAVLFAGSALLLKDYFNYGATWESSILMDDSAAFPSVTLCSQNPFTENAIHRLEQYTSKAPKPKVFTQRLQNLTLNKLLNNKTSFVDTILYDSISTYYANLRLEDTITLSHQQSILGYCILGLGGAQFIAPNCTFEQGLLSVQRFSHMDYFNCYTLRPHNDYAGQVESLIVIASLTPFHKVGSEFLDSQSFLMDILTRGEGMKLVVHAPDTYPNLVDAINIEPGKMNEFTYRTLRSIRVNTPKTKCSSQLDDIIDLQVKYQYSHPECLKAELQKQMIAKCGCMVTEWPRVQLPSVVPYCVNLSIVDNVFNCAGEILLSASKIKKEAHGNTCLLRCEEHTYDVLLSTSIWSPDSGKLARLALLYQGSNDFATTQTEMSRNNYIKAINSNTSNITPDVNYKDDDSNSFTYIQLKRKNFDTMLQTEKLILSVNTLICRIGGLGSLCIGLTAAFVVEMIELVFLYLKQRQMVQKEKSEPNTTIIRKKHDRNCDTGVGMDVDIN